MFGRISPAGAISFEKSIGAGGGELLNGLGPTETEVVARRRRGRGETRPGPTDPRRGALRARRRGRGGRPGGASVRLRQAARDALGGVEAEARNRARRPDGRGPASRLVLETSLTAASLLVQGARRLGLHGAV